MKDRAVERDYESRYRLGYKAIFTRSATQAGLFIPIHIK